MLALTNIFNCMKILMYSLYILSQQKKKYKGSNLVSADQMCIILELQSGDEQNQHRGQKQPQDRTLDTPDTDHCPFSNLF